MGKSRNKEISTALYKWLEPLLPAAAVAINTVRKGIERSDRLGRHRWVVERIHVWLAAFDKLRTRLERSIDIHLTLLCQA